MSWDIPAPGAIAERYALGFERAFTHAPDGTPYPETPDVRSPDTAFRVLGVVGGRDLHGPVSVPAQPSLTS